MAIGLILLIQTLFIAIITGIISKSFWFSYILFLIFLGGILVLFIYVTSLASNEIFSYSIKITIISTILIYSLIILIYFIDKTSIIIYIINREIMPLNNTTSYIQENSLNLNKLYNYPTNIITILLINYLLICLIVIVKITNVFYGPLRLIN